MNRINDCKNCLRLSICWYILWPCFICATIQKFFGDDRGY